MLKRKWNRGVLAGAGLCLSALAGCQAPGTQFASPFAGTAMDHPNAPAMMPASPAFSRVQAGQNLPMMAPQQMMAPGYPQGMPSVQMGMPMPGYPQGMAQQQQQPMMGSGGMVYPVGFQQAQPQMQMAPQYQQQTFAPPPGPAMVYTPAPTAPVTQAPPPVVTGAQPGVQVIQGPNGPITVTTEIFDQPPTAGNAASPPPAQSGNVTFNAPAPVTIPAPEYTALPPASRPPEPLPPALGKAPAGPSLPGLTPPAGLGNYPAVPVGHQHIAPPAAPVKLPAAVGAPSVDDDIPAAPVFLK